VLVAFVSSFEVPPADAAVASAALKDVVSAAGGAHGAQFVVFILLFNMMVQRLQALNHT